MATKLARPLAPQLAAARAPLPFNLGDVLRCRITGATGVASQFSEYLFGCRRWGLTATADDKPLDLWFDEPQLERVATHSGTPPAPQTNGGPRPDTPRPRAPERRR